MLRRLEAHALIARVSRRIGGPSHGSSQTIWQLAAGGERYLRARRGDPARRRYVTPTIGFLEHTLDVARYAAALGEAAMDRGFDLLELGTEPANWRSFQTAAGGQTLKPDLSVVTADSDHETHCFIEIDRGTEHMPAILRKCRLYESYWQSGTEQAIHGLFPSVIWVTPDQTRARRIREAIASDRQLNSQLFHAATAESSLSVVAPYVTPSPKGGTP
ncbi:hypothetical protein ABA31_14790 [Agrococcus baldri]|uniref:Replication-relaxation n=1 Tax=Agrococcus baldri TaxID=153730 RepID=A0AA87URS2_9MICO|nr:hypothetical protein ABA31_14790 [Agrococcus baldri]